jgi:hypothetical protein
VPGGQVVDSWGAAGDKSQGTRRGHTRDGREPSQAGTGLARAGLGNSEAHRLAEPPGSPARLRLVAGKRPQQDNFDGKERAVDNSVRARRELPLALGDAKRAPGEPRQACSTGEPGRRRE